MRFRYPVSLPEDVANALGIEVSNLVTFDTLVRRLTCSSCVPTRLYKYMPRQLAERAFSQAPRRECFAQTSLFSYHFNQGWLEFVLEYDRESLLRRVYLRHSSIEGDLGLEIPLTSRIREQKRLLPPRRRPVFAAPAATRSRSS